MKTEELNYELPLELIAQKPAQHRSESKLLVLDRASNDLRDCRFSDIYDYIRPGDCLVINNTRVLPARFFGHRVSGAQTEGLFLETVGQGSWHVMLKNSRKIKVGEDIVLCDVGKNDYCKAYVSEKLEDGTWIIEPKTDLAVEKLLDVIGFAPLPPYIKRPQGGEAPKEDRQRYQTVFAENDGAVAAPTAGLHFTDELMASLAQKGVNFARVTLHVGAGTFKPVTVDNVEDHDIHSERYEITEENAKLINQTKEQGGRVIAVGTTSVRTLESVAENGRVKACTGSTRLFITPGYEYKIVDTIVTNFHLPKSTLLALVGAFAGMDTIMAAYKHAVEQKYRFFSYGDAMLII